MLHGVLVKDQLKILRVPGYELKLFGINENMDILNPEVWGWNKNGKNIPRVNETKRISSTVNMDILVIFNVFEWYTVEHPITVDLYISPGGLLIPK
jgi:hypothetical protein